MLAGADENGEAVSTAIAAGQSQGDAADPSLPGAQPANDAVVENYTFN